jgi:V8-like Glu-specific endopeptidase
LIKKGVLQQSDFLPLNTLKHGVRCALPVCLLCSDYTLEEARQFVEDLQKSLQNTNADITISELKSLLSHIYQFRESALRSTRKDTDFWKEWEKETLVDLLNKNEFWDGLQSLMLGEVPLGTGFLVGRDYLLTNHHVLINPLSQDSQPIGNVTAYFGYEAKDFLGQSSTITKYQLESKFTACDSSLDYALVKVIPLIDDELKTQKAAGAQLTFSEAGNNLGWFRLTDNETLIAPLIPCLRKGQITSILRNFERFPVWLSRWIGRELDLYFLAKNAAWAKKLINDREFNNFLDPDLKDRLQSIGFQGEPVNIIQHPQGRQKQVVIYNNRVQMLYENFIQYETDAEPGSSGSPIFNAQWQLIGIHHSALLNADNDYEVVGYLGTRMSSITKHLRDSLKESDSNNKLKSALAEFLQNYVDNLIQGKIFISAGRKRSISSSLVPLAKDFESEYLAKLGRMIGEHIDKDKYEYVHIQERIPNGYDSDFKSLINWLKEQEEDYKRGDVAIELRLDIAEPLKYLPDSSEETNPEESAKKIRGARVAYWANSSERRLNADVLSQDFANSIQEIEADIQDLKLKFRNLGSIPVTTDFPQKIRMPTLILYVGYLTNSLDRELLTDEKKLEKVAEAIAQGLMNWSRSLSPL